MSWLLPVSILLGALALVLLLPSISDLISLLKLAVGRGGKVVSSGDLTPRLLFLVPAHDEELLIGRCLGSLQSLDYPANLHGVLVIADNCTDQTAEIARAGGVRCLERVVPELRGKPRAIAWALERIDLAAYDAVIIVDGDTVVDPGYGQAVSKVVGLRAKAVQAFNGISNPDENALTRMSFVLAESYYRFMYPLKQRAGLNPPLTGAGMCVGASVLERFGWPAQTLSEDVEMYVRLTLEGVRTECVPEARVFSQEATSLSASRSQRQRWRAGRLTILTRLGWLLVRSRAVSAHQRLDLISETASPGPAVHLGVVALASPVAILAPLPAGIWIGAAFLGSLLRPVIYTSLAIFAGQRPGRTLVSFLYLPLYTGWRLITELLALAMVGDKPWRRTRRHEEPSIKAGAGPGPDR